MANRVYPTDASGVVNEADWADLFKFMTKNGVLRGELNEFATGFSGLTLSPTGGRGLIDGCKVQWDTTSTRAVTSNGGSANPRTDRLVLRFDKTANTATPFVIAGTPSVSAPPPAVSSTSTVVDVLLYQVHLNAGATTIAYLTDERQFATSLSIGEWTPFNPTAVAIAGPVPTIQADASNRADFRFVGPATVEVSCRLKTAFGSGTAGASYGIRIPNLVSYYFGVGIESTGQSGSALVQNLPGHAMVVSSASFSYGLIQLQKTDASNLAIDSTYRFDSFDIRYRILPQ